MNNDRLPDIDRYSDGPIVEPYDDNIQIDYKGFRDYVTAKYNGDSTDMTQEEKDRFITYRDQQRKTA